MTHLDRTAPSTRARREARGPVVVGVDGTSGSAGALRYAAEQAVRRECGLHLVHVTPGHVPVTPMLPDLPESIGRAGRAILQTAEDRVVADAPGLPVTATVSSGSRILELVAAARRGRLLVVGRETRGILERLVTGTTTAAVVARAPVPVVVVPGEWQPQQAGDRVVVGMGSARGSGELLRAAFEHGRARGLAVEVVHAWRLPDAYADRIEERTHRAAWLAGGSELLEREIAPWRDRYRDVSVTTRVEHDDAARVLVEASRAADLVLLLRPAPDRLLGAHLGSTARHVVAQASCPVEVVPGDVAPRTSPGRDLAGSAARLG